jgi:SAM-dependent methyltransferase
VTSLPISLVKDIIQWDVASWSKILKYWDTCISWGNVHACLELGGRQGGLALWLALKGKTTVCSDLFNPREIAKPLHERYNVTECITYQGIDATNIPYENHFDIIVFKSIIGGIGRNGNIDIQKKVMNEIYKALKPGGKLLLAENLIGSQLHQFLRHNFIKWGKSWRYISLSELEQFFSPFKNYTSEVTGLLSAFGKQKG